MRYYIFLFAFLIPNCIQSQFNWEKLNGPPGGTIYGLYIKGDTLFAGVGYGRGTIFYSVDKGLSWQHSSTKFEYSVDDFIISNDGGILLSAGQMGIYKSLDLTHWENVYPNSLVYKFGKDNNGNLYVGNSENILKSSDNGMTWTISYYGGVGYVQKFELLNNGDLYSGSRNKLFKKTNNFGWDSIVMPVQQNFAPFSDDQGNIYAFSENNLFKSNNGGNNWIELDSAKFLMTISILDMIFNNRIIGGGGAVEGFFPNWGIITSDDSGRTWSVSNNGLPPQFSAVWVIRKSGTETYIGTASAGVFYSSDYGNHWSPRNNGLNGALTNDVLFSNDGSIYTASYGCGLARSSDKGETWTILNNGISNSFTSSIIESDEGTLLTGTAKGTFRSTNKGENWIQTSGEFHAFRMFKDKHNRIYAATVGNGLNRSTDTGLSWMRIDQGFISDQVLSVAIDKSENLFATASGGAIYKSTNDGSSWVELYRSPNIVFMRCITIAPNGYIYVCASRNGLLRSKDSGNTWELLSNGLVSKNPRSVIVTEKGEVIVSTERDFPLVTERHIYSSTDNGDSWMDITGEMKTILVANFTIDNEGHLYLATDESLWRSTFLSTEVTFEPVQKLEYQLSQNYPNPFNPTTTIEFSLPKEENIKLSLYSILGEEIRVLINEKMAAGVHKYTLDASALPSGVYMYRLKSGGFTDTKKLLVLK